MCAERSCRTVALSVAAAVALGPAAAPTAAGEAVACASAKQRHEHFAVFAPQLDRWKRIWAYLPPDYHCSARATFLSSTSTTATTCSTGTQSRPASTRRWRPRSRCARAGTGAGASTPSSTPPQRMAVCPPA